jgi:hypothetical protein
MKISRLSLLTPLYYTPCEEVDPFGCKKEVVSPSGGEELFCFEIDEAQSLSFEPDKDKLLGALVFCGKTRQETPEKADVTMELPRGNYLFAQERDFLKQDDIISMAVEIQAEGLWQRLEPGKRLYLRYLFEDGKGVTQLFRPYSE